MGQFTFTPAPLEGVLIIEPKAFRDERGFFMESYNLKDFIRHGFTHPLVQDNHSLSKKGVLRGLHYQNLPSPLGKLVRCLKGKIFDVGVDIRKGSPTFGYWYGELLDDQNHRMLYFPPGFAHGFLALADDTHVYYKCTGFYSPENERAIIWNDPAIGVKWPLEQVGGRPLLSDRDRSHPTLAQAEINHVYEPGK